jgi:pyruvate dehydrogenase E2 component (dihydrolipoamide acetyltransferase)
MSAADVNKVQLTGLRRTIARKMVDAWQVPVFHLSTVVAIGEAERRRKSVAGATLTDELIRCVAAALVRHPDVNARFVDDAILLSGAVNIGLAVAVDGGLVVPVIHDAEALSLEGIGARRRDIVARSRSRDLVRGDLADGTFTVSNLGMFGVSSFDAILNVPQVAILAVGASRPQIELKGGELVERHVVELTLTGDHRAINGAGLAAFARTLRETIEQDSTVTFPSGR